MVGDIAIAELLLANKISINQRDTVVSIPTIHMYHSIVAKLPKK